MKLDEIIRTKLLRRPYQPSDRRFNESRQLILASAAKIVPHVLDIIPVRSVVDVGCGTGGWLSVFAKHGVEKIVGLDGDYTDRRRLDVDPSCFIAWDLNKPFGQLALGRFDLAMSLEVAEHLSPQRADGLVADLCNLSDVVLFGAAIVGQAGDRHINEQWQSYWVNKFRDRGYDPYDILRPAIWGAAEIPFWYKQNTIYYVKRNSAADAIFRKRFHAPSASMFDVVHPVLFWRELNAYSGLARLRKNIYRMVSQLTGLQLLKPRKGLVADGSLTDRSLSLRHDT